MKIRRYEIDYVFDVLNSSRLHPGLDAVNAKFICIPRYNVCINLRASSIRFFFNYVYKVRTYKTYFIWFLLRLIVILPSLHILLNKIGLSHEIKHIKSSHNINWDRIDLVYVEWHFFGVFSQSEQSVAHVLAKQSYQQRFENELHARRYGKEIKELAEILPKLLYVSDNPKFYVEELAVDLGNHLITNEELDKAQKALIALNNETLKNVSFDAYYRELINKISEIKNHKLSESLNLLKSKLETYLNQNLIVELSLVHGDFNAGQVLTKNGRIKIIDWGDGGLLNRLFDYITIGIYNSPNHEFNPAFFPEDLSILKTFFSEKMNTGINVKLYVLLSLLEILFISKGEFEAQEGAYIRWIAAVKHNVNKL